MVRGAMAKDGAANRSLESSLPRDACLPGLMASRALVAGDKLMSVQAIASAFVLCRKIVPILHTQIRHDDGGPRLRVSSMGCRVRGSVARIM